MFAKQGKFVQPLCLPNPYVCQNSYVPPSLMFPQAYVPSGYVPSALCSLSLMFPQALCSLKLMFPQPYVRWTPMFADPLCSLNLMFAGPYVRPNIYVALALCSPKKLENPYVRTTVLEIPKTKIFDLKRTITFNFERKTNPSTLEHFLTVNT